jgi:hypothetical protein
LVEEIDKIQNKYVMFIRFMPHWKAGSEKIFRSLVVKTGNASRHS